MTEQFYTFKDSLGDTHSLRLSTLNTVNLSGQVVRVSYTNEVLKFTFPTSEEAERVYREILDRVSNC